MDSALHPVSVTQGQLWLTRASVNVTGVVQIQVFITRDQVSVLEFFKLEVP